MGRVRAFYVGRVRAFYMGRVRAFYMGRVRAFYMGRLQAILLNRPSPSQQCYRHFTKTQCRLSAISSDNVQKPFETSHPDKV